MPLGQTERRSLLTIRSTKNSATMDGPLKAAIIVVSTTAAKDPSADASTSVLREVIEGEGPAKWELTQTTIVTDDVLAIQSQLTSITDGPEAANLVITTGGTGFAVTDITPEVHTSSRHGNIRLIRLSFPLFLGGSPLAAQASPRLGACDVINIP